MLLHVNAKSFSSKSLVTLLSALVWKTWKKEQEAETQLVYLMLKDVADFSISNAYILARC